MESWSQLKVRSAVIFTILDFMWIYNKKRSMNSVAFRLAEILWNVQGNFLGQQGNLIYIGTGLILHRGNTGVCLHAPRSLPRCPYNCSDRRKCLGALARFKSKHTVLLGTSQWRWGFHDVHGRNIPFYQTGC